MVAHRSQPNTDPSGVSRLYDRLAAILLRLPADRVDRLLNELQATEESDDGSKAKAGSRH